jgi:GxxExxY protein
MINELTEKIIGAAIEVHRHLGQGLLESAYEECLCREFNLCNITFERQKSLPVIYKGIKLDCAYRLDLIVENKIIIEIKTINQFDPIHNAQLLTYLKLLDLEIGLLINFNVSILKNGIKRIINN